MIRKVKGIIRNVNDLSPTAKELVIDLEEPLPFVAGNFVNLFFPKDGETVRRAFSLSSSDADSRTIALSVRRSRGMAGLTPYFWEHDVAGTPVELMGPLGENTADKLTSKKAFLFAFGVGAGVIRSVADHLVKRASPPELRIMTGSRDDGDIIHKDYFDELAAMGKAHVRYVVSTPGTSPFLSGYIQDHVSDFDFNDADVYMCGQDAACTELQTKVLSTAPKNCRLFVESFG
ncbi:MAG TPA: FAD-dependent oxidoreductase [Candidatus Paceibacterota bacterium]|nr:FAD-dependent oxidoreductase [Candidatus Paceibacterota bacterium]